MTQTELEKELKPIEMVITEKTIGKASYSHGLHSWSPMKSPLVKKRHCQDCLKFPTGHLKKPIDYSENVESSELCVCVVLLCQYVVKVC